MKAEAISPAVASFVDATWHVATGHLKMHIAAGDIRTPSAACDKNLALPGLHMNLFYGLSEVPESRRCKRPGCREHWPAQE